MRSPCHSQSRIFQTFFKTKLVTTHEKEKAHMQFFFAFSSLLSVLSDEIKWQVSSNLWVIVKCLKIPSLGIRGQQQSKEGQSLTE